MGLSLSPPGPRRNPCLTPLCVCDIKRYGVLAVAGRETTEDERENTPHGKVRLRLHRTLSIVLSLIAPSRARARALIGLCRGAHSTRSFIPLPPLTRTHDQSDPRNLGRLPSLLALTTVTTASLELHPPLCRVGLIFLYFWRVSFVGLIAISCSERHCCAPRCRTRPRREWLDTWPPLPPRRHPTALWP